jgi:hypothetical protein
VERGARYFASLVCGRTFYFRPLEYHLVASGEELLHDQDLRVETQEHSEGLFTIEDPYGIGTATSPPCTELLAEPELLMFPSRYSLLDLLETIYQDYAGTSVLLRRLIWRSKSQKNPLDGYPNALERAVTVHGNEERLTKIFHHYKGAGTRPYKCNTADFLFLFCHLAVPVPQVSDAPVRSWEREIWGQRLCHAGMAGITRIRKDCHRLGSYIDFDKLVLQGMSAIS